MDCRHHDLDPGCQPDDAQQITLSNSSDALLHFLTSTSSEMLSENDSYVGNSTEFYPLVRQPLHMIVVYALAYGIVFVLCVLGNSLVVCVVVCNPSMHTVTNYFIVNLAVADLLVGVFCLPITLLANLFSGWHFGAAMCKTTPFLQGVAVSASVSTLAAIAFDRYLAICHLMEVRITRKVARIVILLVWVCAAIIMSPWAVFFQQVDISTDVQTIYICNQFWPSENQKRGYFLGVIVLSCYTVPLLLITVFYTLIGCRVWNRDAPGAANTSQVIHRSKVRVVKMLVVVVIGFAFCWLPLYAVNVRLFFGPPLVESSPEFHVLTQTVIPVVQWFGLSSCSVNPIVYCLFSGKFRAGFRALLFSGSCCCCCSSSYVARYAVGGLSGRSTVVSFAGGRSVCGCGAGGPTAMTAAGSGRRGTLRDGQHQNSVGRQVNGNGGRTSVDFRRYGTMATTVGLVDDGRLGVEMKVRTKLYVANEAPRFV